MTLSHFSTPCSLKASTTSNNAQYFTHTHSHVVALIRNLFPLFILLSSFVGAEVIAAAEQQLEAAGGIVDTSFITITVTIAADDPSKREVFAYQVTKQGMEMAAEGALVVSPNLGMLSEI